MPLRARLEPVTRDRLIPGDAAIDVRIVNDGSEPEIFHEHQARRSSLMLQLGGAEGACCCRRRRRPTSATSFPQDSSLRASR